MLHLPTPNKLYTVGEGEFVSCLNYQPFPQYFKRDHFSLQIYYASLSEKEIRYNITLVNFTFSYMKLL